MQTGKLLEGAVPAPYCSDKSKNNVSNIFQGDSNDTISSYDSDSSDNTSDTDFNTDDEIDPEPLPANLVPSDVPGKLTVSLTSNSHQSSYIPLGIMLNARSVYNKIDNLKEILNQISPDLLLVSETWEQEKKQLKNIFC